jgi:hypothetical protein
LQLPICPYFLPLQPTPPNQPRNAEAKYSEISKTHLLFPLAFGTMGPVNQTEQEFISELGHRIFASTDDPRETYFLFQTFRLLYNDLTQYASPTLLSTSKTLMTTIRDAPRDETTNFNNF